MPEKTDREREINYTINIIKGILCQHRLTLMADLERGHLVVIDDTTGKKYGILLE